MRIRQIIILFGMACMLAGCDRHQEPTRVVSLELNMCLPAEEIAHYAPRRVMGDPGSREVFALPRYAYIFILKGSDIWRKEEMVLDTTKWERTKHTGRLVDKTSDIYKYSETLQFLLNGDTPTGQIFAICSNKQLTLSTAMGSISSASDVLDLKFNTAPDSIQANLQNIYSTPYNYKVDGKYYCFYDCSIGNRFTVDLLLYHIAAKVDLTWFVAEDKRINKDNNDLAVRLTQMDAKELFNGYAYCFKPLRNELATKLADGKDIDNIVTPSDEGLWWEGRKYFYTIPYTVTGTPDYFPLQMRMRTNGSGFDYRPTFNLQIDTTAEFVPWLRANIILTKPLANKDTTIIVNN